jgi:prepilin-type N-terminal cleavage/methylation domain-containing protein
MKNFKKGFTLIELLVVVAIIGILASVVLASLNTARAKGADAAIKANLANMRAQAAIYYDTNSKYSAAAVTCTVTSGGAPSGCTDLFNDPTMLAGLKAAAASSGATLDATTTSDGSAYAIDAALKATSGTMWCVDSTGKSEQVTASVSALTVCP